MDERVQRKRKTLKRIVSEERLATGGTHTLSLWLRVGKRQREG